MSERGEKSMSFGPDSGAESSWASYLNSTNLHLGSSGVVRQRCSKNEMRFLSICLLISPYILHTHPPPPSRTIVTFTAVPMESSMPAEV